jgi:hypothetical protein
MLLGRPLLEPTFSSVERLTRSLPPKERYEAIHAMLLSRLDDPGSSCG